MTEPELVVPEGSDPETLSVHLDTLWRLAAEETAKYESLERKALAVASLSGFVAAVNGAFGLNVVRTEGGWPLIAYVLSFLLLLAAVACAAVAVRPVHHKVFGVAHIRGLETPAQLTLTPSQARLATIAGLIKRVTDERHVIERRKCLVNWSFGFFGVGLALVMVEASALALKLTS